MVFLLVLDFWEIIPFQIFIGFYIWTFFLLLVSDSIFPLRNNALPFPFWEWVSLCIPRKAYQIRTIPKKLNVEPPTWTLKVIGRILEDGVDPDQPGAVQKSNPFYPNFSSFFKRVTIQLDQRLYLANL